MKAATTIVRYTISPGASAVSILVARFRAVGVRRVVVLVSGRQHRDRKAIEQRRRGKRQRISGRLRLDGCAGEHVAETPMRPAIRIGEAPRQLDSGVAPDGLPERRRHGVGNQRSDQPGHAGDGDDAV